MDKIEAYKVVFLDLIEAPIYLGVYDAYNGDEHFMNGIYSVMKSIMRGADLNEDLADTYTDTFFSNMEKSQEEAERRRMTDEIIGSFEED